MARAVRDLGSSRNGRAGDASRISDYTVRRLSVYCHLLEELESDRIDVVSSAKLAHLAGTNSAQVR